MLDLVIEQRRRNLGGFDVGRVLPFAKRRMVGPFIFFDHIGPVDFPPGIPNNVDVRPPPRTSSRPSMPVLMESGSWISCIRSARG